MNGILTFLLLFGDRETDFVIRLSPVSASKGITAAIVTTNLYPCAGHRLRAYSTREMGTITVHINGMVRPVPCVQGGEVATGNTYLFRPLPLTSEIRLIQHE
jgi:hypothetical protein